MKQFLLSRLRSFRHAFRGWWYVLHTQRNAWIHGLVATAVFILGFWLGLPPRDWAVLILTIAMVFAAEFINTAIEAVVDLATQEHHPLAKVGKDVGAAAVLIAALAAVLIGLLILGPPLMAKVNALPEQSTRSEQTAFKGMELYSWQGDDGEWKFAILPGTNRYKTLDEVKAEPLDRLGVNKAITQMAVGEWLFWGNSVYDEKIKQMVSLPFPPKEAIEELKAFTVEMQVNLIFP